MLNGLKDFTTKNEFSTRSECLEHTYKDEPNCAECIPKGCVSISKDGKDTIPTPTIHTNRIALTAGLLSGLFLFLSIAAVTLICYRKRKRQRLTSVNEEAKIVNILNVSQVPTSSSLSSKKDDKTLMDHCHPNSPFIVGAYSLQIPHLDIHQPSVFKNDLIRRSLSIQHTIIPMRAISRSSSVKLTKFEYDAIQATSSLNENRQSISFGERSLSNNRTNSTKITENHAKDICSCIDSSSGYLCCQVHEIDFPAETSSAISTQSDESGNITFYFSASNTHIQTSTESNISLSTLGDGEITVYYDPTNNS